MSSYQNTNDGVKQDFMNVMLSMLDEDTSISSFDKDTINKATCFIVLAPFEIKMSFLLWCVGHWSLITFLIRATSGDHHLEFVNYLMTLMLSSVLLTSSIIHSSFFEHCK
ncbi:hypothetical protein QQ045_022030 [Rhodiola kirilowii]